MITVYFKAEQSCVVNEPKVMMNDIASIYCSDTNIEQKVKSTKLFNFPANENGKECFSILKVIELIQNQFKDVLVINAGETDFIIYYKPKDSKKESKFLYMLKAVGICLTGFFGAAFTIMTYNKDVGADEIFYQAHKLFTGEVPVGPSFVQIFYSLGLSAGIIIFFNHAANKKLSDDPTPFQVQMRLYERDVNDTFIIGADRKEETIDVD